jgi:hypothetical protein
MVRMRRWFGKGRKLVWSEPKLPPFVKINPHATVDPDAPLQPGDITMGALAQQFLDFPEEDPP